jgi:hypothetical protein
VNRSISRLGTSPDVVTVSVDEKIGWFRRRSVPRDFTFLDWVIGDALLRELIRWPTGEVAGEVTPIQNDYAFPEFAVLYLRALLGGDPQKPWETHMPDGRVGLLYCPIDFDNACRTLTTELKMNPDTVEWRDIVWQASYEDLDFSEQTCPVISLSFDRVQYEAVIDNLLQVEERRLEMSK